MTVTSINGCGYNFTAQYRALNGFELPHKEGKMQCMTFNMSKKRYSDIAV